MIITLAGENSFALQRELRHRVDAFVAGHGDLALERIDGEEADFARLREAVTGLPFLAAKKLVLLRAPSKNKQFLEEFEQLFGEAPETNDIVIVEPKLDKRLAYYKYLKKSTDFHDFPELDLNGVAKWLVDAAKELEGTISSSDARYLAERVGLNQQLLSNELEKLVLYNPKITHQTIDLLTDAAPQSTVFELLEAAFAGNTRRMLGLYADQRAQKVEPQQIIAMLGWQLHVLAVIKTAGDRSADQIAKEAKLNPFVVRKSQGIARGLTLVQLKKLISDLLAIDTDSKRSALDTDEALQNYLLRLAA
jgi:DNA polymerase-3 subunit delta